MPPLTDLQNTQESHIDTYIDEGDTIHFGDSNSRNYLGARTYTFGNVCAVPI